MSFAKKKVIAFIAGLPEVKKVDHLQQVVQYITDQHRAANKEVEDTSVVDKAIVDSASRLFCSMRLSNTTGQGTLNKTQKIVKEILLTVVSKASTAANVKKSMLPGVLIHQ